MPIDRTHDITHSPFHVKDVKALGDLLNSAATAAFPNQGVSRYKEIHALLLSWEDDSLGVLNEIGELDDVLRQIYHFEVERWKIPSKRSHNTLAAKLLAFLDDYESKENLLLVYYGGHGSMNDDRQCVWSCSEFWALTASYHTKAYGSTEKVDSPEVQWYGLQTMLEQARSDVLILLDCCAAASSATGSGNGITEIIAACGFEAWAPDVGQHSFTRSLVDELKYLGGMGPFSTSLLHNKVLSRVKYWKPRFAPSASHREMRKTPIYIVISNETRPRSIELEPLRLRRLKDDNNRDISPASSIRGSTFSSLSISVDQASTSGIASESSSSSLDDVWPDKKFDCPKVLMSIALEEEQWLSPQHWTDWIRSIPALVKYANIEGIYKSDSTMLLISVPIAIWNLVPADPAISFVGFQKSQNLLVSYPFNGDANVKLAQAEAVAPLTERRSESENSETTYDLADHMLEELKVKDLEVKDLRHEIRTAKAEAERAWEVLGRLEKEDLIRTEYLRHEDPTLAADVQVVYIYEKVMSKENLSTSTSVKDLGTTHAHISTGQRPRIKSEKKRIIPSNAKMDSRIAGAVEKGELQVFEDEPPHSALTVDPTLSRPEEKENMEEQDDTEYDLAKSYGALPKQIDPIVNFIGGNDLSQTAIEILKDPENVLYFEVFTAETSVWMESFDYAKTISHTIPLICLHQPLLLHAVLACGAYHLFLLGRGDTLTIAEELFNIATKELDLALAAPQRNVTLCAVTALVLDVYSIITQLGQRTKMRHSAEAHALIEECGWNGKSTSTAVALLWFHLTTEIIDCIMHIPSIGRGPRGTNERVYALGYSTPQMTGDCEALGYSAPQMTGDPRTAEEWLHAIIILLAKIVNFHSQHFSGWEHLAWWQSSIPQDLQPLVEFSPSATSISSFPRYCFLSRLAIIANLLYHLAVCLLAKIDQLNQLEDLKLSSADSICGIMAGDHMGDRILVMIGVPALRIAGECLENKPKEQDEFLKLLIHIEDETGWRSEQWRRDFRSLWNTSPTCTATRLTPEDDGNAEAVAGSRQVPPTEDGNASLTPQSMADKHKRKNVADFTRSKKSKVTLEIPLVPRMESFFCRQATCPLATEGGFSSEKDRDQHEAEHEPRVLCQWEDCGRVFSRVDNMRDHMRRIHHQSSPVKTLNQVAVSSTDLSVDAVKPDGTIVPEREEAPGTSKTIRSRNAPSEVMKPKPNKKASPQKGSKQPPEPRGHVKKPSAHIGQPGVSQYPDISYQVPSSPNTQWWCGNCWQGPLSIQLNLACLFCHRPRDYTAYSERPRTRR